jgi:preprotein translocase subunit SecG
MSTWETLLLVLLVINALSLGAIVLVQQGRGADIGAAFGSGAANTMFGGQGAGSFLAKITTWLAIGFFVISFGLAYLAKERAATMQDIGMPRVTQPVPTPADEPEAPPRDFLDIPDL